MQISYFGIIPQSGATELLFIEKNNHGLSKKYSKILDIDNYASIIFLNEEINLKGAQNIVDLIRKVSPNALFIEGNAEKDSIWQLILHNFETRLKMPPIFKVRTEVIKSSIVKINNKEAFFIGVPDRKKPGPGGTKLIELNKYYIRKTTYGIMPVFAMTDSGW